MAVISSLTRCVVVYRHCPTQLELWLFFGWNKHAVPSISEMDNGQ